MGSMVAYLICLVSIVALVLCGISLRRSGQNKSAIIHRMGVRALQVVILVIVAVSVVAFILVGILVTLNTGDELLMRAAHALFLFSLVFLGIVLFLAFLVPLRLFRALSITAVLGLLGVLPLMMSVATQNLFSITFNQTGYLLPVLTSIVVLAGTYILLWRVSRSFVPPSSG